MHRSGLWENRYHVFTSPKGRLRERSAEVKAGQASLGTKAARRKTPSAEATRSLPRSSGFNFRALQIYDLLSLYFCCGGYVSDDQFKEDLIAPVAPATSHLSKSRCAREYFRPEVSLRKRRPGRLSQGKPAVTRFRDRKLTLFQETLVSNLGLSFISPAPQVKADFFLQMARKTEEIGLHSLWLNDRVTYDNFEPLSTLAAAAAVTSKIKLGTSVLLAPLRRPVLLAKTLATIDFISQGRLILGVGLGNRPADYEAVQVPFEHRGARVLESIQLMRRLWREDCVSFEGKFFRVQEVALGPKPFANRSIPIWMGGSVEPVLKRAAQFADGLLLFDLGTARFPRDLGQDLGLRAQCGSGSQ